MQCKAMVQQNDIAVSFAVQVIAVFSRACFLELTQLPWD